MNLHLATSIGRRDGTISTMTMLYKVASGVVRDDHYGIALAKTMGFPPRFISVAERVAHDLQRKREAKKQSSEAARLMKKRKLVLNLEETLRRVIDAGMERNALFGFLKRLQAEFIDKMVEIEEEGEDDRRSPDEGEEKERGGGGSIIEIDEDNGGTSSGKGNIEEGEEQL